MAKYSEGLILTHNTKKMDGHAYFINALTDYAFKKIFGTEANKHFLLAFLNSFITSGTIIDVEYLPQEQIGNAPDEKDVIFDIYCKNQKGERFIIEMQRDKQHFFEKRIITYIARVITSCSQRGDYDYNIPNVYAICLLDFQSHIFPNKEQFMRQILFTDVDHNVFGEVMMIYLFNLVHFAENSPKRRREFSTQLEKWLYYIKNIKNMNKQDYLEETDPLFKDLLEQCSYSKLNETEKQQYKKSLLEYEGIRDAVSCAHEDGEVIGYEAGHNRGRKEGRKEGRLYEKYLVTKKLLKMGMEIPAIIQATGLTEEQILSCQ